jgi:enoyl-CoA hydratase/carnithine racemase/NAD(P)-dependent dehydrogenase (short-subunit alcohol dehydrogenase family)
VTTRFSDYSTRYDHIAMERDSNGVLEVRFHSDDGHLVWGDGPHTELSYAFTDIAADHDNRVVIITGTGDRFCSDIDDSWVGEMSPAKWDKIYTHGRRLLQRLLEIEVPVIGAVNGPASVHAEIAVLSDIVLASDNAFFSDAPHFRFGTVPGDGVQVIWPLLLGPNRGRYFLLTGQRISAEEALRLGVVNEVLPADELMTRARQLAELLARQPDTTLRYTRDAVTQPLKRALLDNLGYGLALEGLGAYASWPKGEGGTCATATILAERGADVLIADRDETTGRATADGIGADFIGLDVTDAAAWDRIGPVDFAHLSAGTMTRLEPCSIDDLTASNWRRVHDVNVEGVVNGILALVPGMKTRGGGSIVVMGSLAAFVGFGADPFYAATKATLVNLARSLAEPLGSVGVRINAVCPGEVATGMLPPDRADILAAAGHRPLRADEVAEAVVGTLVGDSSGGVFTIVTGRGLEPYEFGGVPRPLRPESGA